MPLAEHDHRSKARVSPSCVSIHVPLAEHDLQTLKNNADNSGFNSRAPRGARRITQYHSKRFNSFNSRAPRGARRQMFAAFTSDYIVSIHVPLAEHDVNLRAPYAVIVSFNSRAPRGARHTTHAYSNPVMQFQFTCPSRSTTIISIQVYTGILSFNSRAPRGARRRGSPSQIVPASFNSRAPRGARLTDVRPGFPQIFVSIHVPLAEHDFCVWRSSCHLSRFNSRAPRGARR